jgi:hypothetical protein
MFNYSITQLRNGSMEGNVKIAQLQMAQCNWDNFLYRFIFTLSNFQIFTLAK